jgi:hypothetical protein
MNAIGEDLKERYRTALEKARYTGVYEVVELRGSHCLVSATNMGMLGRIKTERARESLIESIQITDPEILRRVFGKKGGDYNPGRNTRGNREVFGSCRKGKTYSGKGSIRQN